MSDALPGPLTASFVALDLAVFVLTYWTGEPWGALPLAAPLAVLGGLIALMAPVGVLKLLRTPALSAARGPVVAATLAVLGMVAVFTVAGGIAGMLAPHFQFSSPFLLVLPKSVQANAFIQASMHPALTQVQNVLGKLLRLVCR